MRYESFIKEEAQQVNIVINMRKMYEFLRFLILLLYNVSAYDYQLNLALNYQIILKAMTNKC